MKFVDNTAAVNFHGVVVEFAKALAKSGLSDGAEIMRTLLESNLVSFEQEPKTLPPDSETIFRFCTTEALKLSANLVMAASLAAAAHVKIKAGAEGMSAEQREDLDLSEGCAADELVMKVQKDMMGFLGSLKALHSIDHVMCGQAELVDIVDELIGKKRKEDLN